MTRASLICLLAFSLVACISQPLLQTPRGCDVIIENVSAEFPVNETSAKSLQAWIEKHYAVRPDVVSVSDGTKFFFWTTSVNQQIDKRYEVTIFADHSKFSYEFKQNSPSVADLFRCAGFPAGYRAKYHRDPNLIGALTVDFAYPQKSAFARVNRWGENTPLTESTEIKFVEVMTSTTVGYKRYAFEFGPFTSWPGRLDAVVVSNADP